MSWHAIAACVIGYGLVGLLALYIGLFIYGHLWYPIASLTADIRVARRCGSKIRWAQLPKCYWERLGQAWRDPWLYGESTITYHGVAVWTCPTHPFSFGSIEWMDGKE